jgi:hypothetical protein
MSRLAWAVALHGLALLVAAEVVLSPEGPGASAALCRGPPGAPQPWWCGPTSRVVEGLREGQGGPGGWARAAARGAAFLARHGVALQAAALARAPRDAGLLCQLLLPLAAGATALAGPRKAAHGAPRGAAAAAAAAAAPVAARLLPSALAAARMLDGPMIGMVALKWWWAPAAGLLALLHTVRVRRGGGAGHAGCMGRLWARCVARLGTMRSPMRGMHAACRPAGSSAQRAAMRPYCGAATRGAAACGARSVEPIMHAPPSSPVTDLPPPPFLPAPAPLRPSLSPCTPSSARAPRTSS